MRLSFRCLLSHLFPPLGSAIRATQSGPPMQGGQIEATVANLLYGSTKRRKPEPPNHVFPTVTARNRIATAMARQCIIYILVYAGSAQGVIEAMAKRMKHVARVVDTQVTLVAPNHFENASPKPPLGPGVSFGKSRADGPPLRRTWSTKSRKPIRINSG